MTNKKLVALGVKKKGEKEFTVKFDVNAALENMVRAHIIHNGTQTKRCGICGSEIHPGLCVCENCGSSDD